VLWLTLLTVVAHLHGIRLVHGDVKPENVFLQDPGAVQRQNGGGHAWGSGGSGARLLHAVLGDLPVGGACVMDRACHLPDSSRHAFESRGPLHPARSTQQSTLPYGLGFPVPTKPYNCNVALISAHGLRHSAAWRSIPQPDMIRFFKYASSQ
jgi:serine/threonine protein kinase